MQQNPWSLFRCDSMQIYSNVTLEEKQFLYRKAILCRYIQYRSKMFSTLKALQNVLVVTTNRMYMYTVKALKAEKKTTTKKHGLWTGSC